MRQRRQKLIFALVCVPDLVLPLPRAEGRARCGNQRNRANRALKQGDISQIFDCTADICGIRTRSR